MAPEKTSREDDAIGRVADSRNFNTVLQEVADGAHILTMLSAAKLGPSTALGGFTSGIHRTSGLRKNRFWQFDVAS
ncbi:MAG: hypothetical protein OXN90_06845 [Gemmatimonadota bacterium]|nr:hypothetical protein [Gemmatimonadota bacterium]